MGVGGDGVTTSLETLFGETTWPESLPTHLSASQITMFQRCREQYRRRYILGEKERPGAALVWGSADHYAHEVNFAQKIESHTDLPLADVELAFAEGFDAAVERNGGESEVEWGKDKPGAMKDDGVKLVAAYHKLVSPKVQPTAVESEFSLEIPGVAVPVIGRIDLETAGPAIERKTAKRSSKTVDPKWRIQGLIYQLAHGKSVDWHLSIKSKVPNIVTPETEPGLTLPYVPGVARAAETLIAHTAAAILSDYSRLGPDEPWEGAITHPWACVGGFCGYKSTCFWWGNS